MTKEEFKDEFRRLLAAFPHFNPAAPEDVARLWLEKIGGFDRAVAHRAFEEAIDAGGQFFPEVGQVARRCREIVARERAERIREALGSCTICFGTGWEFIEEGGMKRVKKCSCIAGL